MNTPEVPEGSMVLRAKLDMANPNMHFRDPIIYRIIHTPHHRTGTKWNCYPMYDFAHGQSDYFEGVTHSICTLEFVPHRPLYDKFIDLLKESDNTADVLNDNRPRQIEFNRLNLTYTVMSKRKTTYSCRRETCKWLGRSSYADTLRNASSWLFSRIYPCIY